MAIALDPNQKIPFVLKRDRNLPKEEQTTFYSRVITVRRLQELTDKYTRRSEKKNEWKFAVEELISLINEFLAGWENFKLPDGTQAEFKMDPGMNGTRKIAEESWRHIDSFEYMGELFDGFMEANHLGEARIKN